MQKYTIQFSIGFIELFEYTQREAIQRALKIRKIHGFINNQILTIKREV